MLCVRITAASQCLFLFFKFERLKITKIYIFLIKYVILYQELKLFSVFSNT